jgi:hypothetical protein
MNEPEEKNALFGFHDAVLMSKFAGAKLSEFVISSHVSISVLPGSLRLSNQMTWMPPSSSTETHGKNCHGAAEVGIRRDTFCMSCHVAP